jgi:phosphate starvation-inducible PhoH-like protein
MDMAKQNRQKVMDNKALKKEMQGKVVNKEFIQREAPKPVVAKNDFQKALLHALKTSQVVITIAPAGTGKSLCIMSDVSDRLKNNKVDKIILTRANVVLGKTIGMLPKGIDEKMAPLLAPLVEVIKQRHGTGFYDTQVGNGNIEILPLEYVRGRNFDGVTVVEESQNLSPDEIFSLITRVTDNGCLYLLGDSAQSDLKGKDGLTWLREFVEDHDLGDCITVVNGTSDDIVRGEICKRFVKAMENHKASK